MNPHVEALREWCKNREAAGPIGAILGTLEAYDALQAQLDRRENENTTLRAIASKLMPCHYCGVDSIVKCPHGFPGCALADDEVAADECANYKLREVVALVKGAEGLLSEAYPQKPADWFKDRDAWRVKVIALLNGYD